MTPFGSWHPVEALFGIFTIGSEGDFIHFRLVWDSFLKCFTRETVSAVVYGQRGQLLERMIAYLHVPYVTESFTKLMMVSRTRLSSLRDQLHDLLMRFDVLGQLAHKLTDPACASLSRVIPLSLARMTTQPYRRIHADAEVADEVRIALECVFEELFVCDQGRWLSPAVKGTHMKDMLDILLSVRTARHGDAWRARASLRLIAAGALVGCRRISGCLRSVRFLLPAGGMHLCSVKHHALLR